MFVGNLTKITNINLKFFSLAGLFLISLILSVALPFTANATGNWQGEYWNLDEGEYIAGSIPDRSPDLSRQDAEINFEWEEGSPDDSIWGDYFAARWTKSVYFEAKSYDFETGYDDRMRITVDGETVYDDWAAESQGSNEIYVSESAGYKEVVVEYWEDAGWAKAIFFMTALTTPPEAKQVIGQSGFNTDEPNFVPMNDFGFSSPETLTVDSVNHRLFVADDGNRTNRILVFNLNENNQLIDKHADYAIGQATTTTDAVNCDDAETASASTVCEPSGMVVDENNNRLFVADRNNSRVLVYELDNLSNGMEASFVLGQANFTDINCNRDGGAGAGTLCEPGALDYDHDNDWLYVSDTDNSRILVFDVHPVQITNGKGASFVLGQADFESSDYDRGGSAAANTLDYPDGVMYDEASGRLVVADQDNSRVLIYNAYDGITNGENAESVLGQSDFTSQESSSGNNRLYYPSGVSYSADRGELYIVDEENNRVVVYDHKGDGLEDISNGAQFYYVLGQADFDGEYSNRDEDSPAANTLSYPNHIYAIPGSNIVVVADDGNDRVVFYDAEELTNGEDAIDVLGQDDFTKDYELGAPKISASSLSNPSDVTVDSKNNRVFVADRFNGRVVLYDTDTNGTLVDQVADGVIGQPDMLSGHNYDDEGCPSPSQDNICAPYGIAYDSDNERLFVSDSEWHRVLVFDVNPATFENGQNATHVLGQAGFTNSAADRGDDAARNSLHNPIGLVYDKASKLLYIADTDNHRVVAYNVTPGTISNGMDADRVIGQSGYTGGECNRNDFASANTLCSPKGIAINEDGQTLFIADEQNDRILIHQTGGSFENGQNASGVIGQPDMQLTDCNRDTNPGADTLCGPYGVAFDERNKLVYIADTENDRVVRYQMTNNFDGSQNADLVYGQLTFSKRDCNQNDNGPTKYTLCHPGLIATNQSTGELWVVDADNSRVLGYGKTTQPSDSDNDGKNDEAENQGPNNGDANNDGTPDSEQANVVSFVNTETGKYLALEVDEACSISSASTEAEADLNVQDSGFNYSAGLLNFTADCGTPGYETSVKIYQYGLNKDGLTVRKHNPNTNAFFTVLDAELTETKISEQIVTIASLNITDGEDLDIDGEANGVIVDPAGLASSAVGAPNTGLGGGR